MPGRGELAQRHHQRRLLPGLGVAGAGVAAGQRAQQQQRGQRPAGAAWKALERDRSIPPLGVICPSASSLRDSGRHVRRFALVAGLGCRNKRFSSTAAGS
jgi:hypothetical protein